MIRKWVARMGVVLSILGTPHLVHSGGVDGGLRLAILAGEGERAPSAETIVLLEAVLSQQPGLALLERAEIDKILKEQELTVSGLVDPPTAVRLGKLLPVDLFLFLDRIQWPHPAGVERQSEAALPRAKGPACRLRIVEARTGIVLADGVLSAEELSGDARPALALVRLARIKQSTPLAQRHFLSILEFRSEEPGESFGGLPWALQGLLPVDLNASPSVVLIDREHLGYLSREQGLAGVELQLKSSAVIVQGGITRTTDEGKLKVQVYLRRAASEPTEPLEVVVPANGVRQARQLVTQAILDTLQARPAATSALDHQQEAEILRERARDFRHRGDYASAVAVVEAIYALEPSLKNLESVAAMWRALGFQLGYTPARKKWGTGRLARSGNSTQEDMPTERKIRALRTAHRALQLSYDICRSYIERAPNAPRRKDEPKVLRYPVHRPLCLAIQPDEKEVERLWLQNLALQEQIVSSVTAYRARQAGRPEPQCLGAWPDMVREIHWYPRWPERQVALIRRVVNAIEATPPDKEGTAPVAVPFSILGPGLINHCQRIRTGSGRDAERRAFVTLCQELTQGRDPYVRILGYAGLIVLQEEALDPARQLLDVFARELPPEHPYRARSNRADPDNTAIALLVDVALRTLAREAPNDLDAFCRREFGGWIKQGDVARIYAWLGEVRLWLSTLERQERWDAALAIVTTFLDGVAQRSEGGWRKDWALREFTKRKLGYERRVGHGSGVHQAWQEYEILPMDLRARRAPAAVVTKGKELYCASTDGRDVTVVAYTFGSRVKRRVLGTFPVGRVSGLALRDETLYLASGACVLAIPLRGGSVKTYGASEGLPGTGIGVQSFALFQGRFYLGLGIAHGADSGFACYDPQTKASQIIASSTSIKPRNKLDGASTYYVWGILPDRERGCLWLAIEDLAQFRRRGGLWRYALRTGELTHVWCDSGSPHISEIKHLRWVGDRIYCHVDWLGHLLVDPDKLSADKVLYRRFPASAPKDGKAAPLFGGYGIGMWPAVFDGDRLITGGRHLYMHRRNQAPAELPKWPNGQEVGKVEVLERIPTGILAIGSKGEAYLIRRKKGGAR